MKKQIMFGLFLIFLMVVPIAAQPDGLTSTEEGKVFLTGTVTKHITNPNDIFQGSYGSGKTFTLGDNSTGLSNFRLQNGEIGGVFGNITADPAQIVHGQYNSSGLLDKSDWTESDVGSIMTVSYSSTNSLVNAMNAIRLYGDFGTGTINYPTFYIDLAKSVSLDKYLNLGIYVLQNTLNTTSLSINFKDLSGDALSVVLESGTDGDAIDWSTIESTDNWVGLRFDGQKDDVIYVSMKLSDILSKGISTIDVTTITTIQILLGRIKTANDVSKGVISVDIFDLSFSDTPLRFGLDRNDQITNVDDYVAINVTDPSNPDMRVRELDGDISYIVDAEIDFIADVQKADTVYDDVNFRVTDEYEMKLATPVEWQNEVTLSNMKLYHVLDRDYSDYLTYSFNDADSQSLILNEVAGDVITLSSSIIEDVTYRLKYQVQLSEQEYDLLVADAGAPQNLFEKIQDWLFGILAMITIFGISRKAKAEKRAKRTQRANRR